MFITTVGDYHVIDRKCILPNRDKVNARFYIGKSLLKGFTLDEIEELSGYSCLAMSIFAINNNTGNVIKSRVDVDFLIRSHLLGKQIPESTASQLIAIANTSCAEDDSQDGISEDSDIDCMDAAYEVGLTAGRVLMARETLDMLNISYEKSLCNE